MASAVRHASLAAFLTLMQLNNLQLLKQNRHFRNLLAGQYISELGNWFNFIAGLSLVRAVSGESVNAATILLVCRTLSWSLVMPFAGTLVDRLSRRNVMLVTDLARAGVALVFLLVTKPEDLWIAYLGSVVLSVLSAFFDGAKSAATPNLVGKEGLMAGTALMFSSRFMLMAVGSALGGLAAATLGYKIAFIINAASFLVSAYTVWLIPEEATGEKETRRSERESFFTEMKEGVSYMFSNHLVFTMILLNFIWAVGGGAVNLIAERLGGIELAGMAGLKPDVGVAALMTAAGAGLFLGTIVAHRVGSFVAIKKITNQFIGWALIIHGVLFGVAGYMPNLWLVSLLFFISRLIVGAEYAVQETLFQRVLPDRIRGRISTLDRGIEITMFSLVTLLSGFLLNWISPQMLTLVSGLISGSSGVVWFLRIRNEASGNREEGFLSIQKEPG